MEGNHHVSALLSRANPEESEQGTSMHLQTTAFYLRQVSLKNSCPEQGKYENQEFLISTKKLNQLPT